MNDIPLDVMRARIARQKRGGGAFDIPAHRAAIDLTETLVTLPEGLGVEATTIAGVPAEWLRPANRSGKRLFLYLHGGGFVAGSCKSHRHMTASMAVAARADALLLDYRLAPEHTFPAAQDDATAAYRQLLTDGHRGEHISIVGDSAGGALVVGVLAGARKLGLPMPARVVLLSPWLDMECRSGSYARLAEADPGVSREGLLHLASLYRGQGQALFNPIEADVADFPPVLTQVGSEEVLLDEAVLFHERLSRAGIRNKIEVWPGAFHVWQGYTTRLREARDAVAKIGAFLAGF